MLVWLAVRKAMNRTKTPEFPVIESEYNQQPFMFVKLTVVVQ